jgi:hypothetical protein
MGMLFTFFVACLITNAGCQSKKGINPQMFNPLGLEYDNVIDYLEQNNFAYQREVEDGSNFLIYEDVCNIDKENGEIIKICTFNNDDICCDWGWLYPQSKYDAVVAWLNKNYKKVSDKSMEFEDWQDSNQNIISINGNERQFVVSHIAEKYLISDITEDRLILDCTIIRYLDDDNKEKTDWREDNNRFVFPVDSNGEINGDIIHYRETGKKRTYRIIENFTHEIIAGVENKYALIVNENDEEALFYYDNYNNSPFVEVSLDGQVIQFSNKDLEERMKKMTEKLREEFGEEFDAIIKNEQ